jgi:hypothetical protein
VELAEEGNASVNETDFEPEVLPEPMQAIIDEVGDGIYTDKFDCPAAKHARDIPSMGGYKQMDLFKGPIEPNDI